MTIPFALPRRGVALLALLALVGCGPREQIHSYDVAKPANAESETATASGEYRILGAMFPADEPRWFFKLTGPADTVAAHEAEFDQFLKSVYFPDGPSKPPKYDLPAGWQSSGSRGMRVDTIRIGEGKKALELTVVQAAGSAKDNVKRWAGQVGGTADPTKSAKEITTAKGEKGVRVDVRGPKNPAASGGPFMGGR